MREFESIGCIVRDLEKGLVDFPAVLDGEEVFLFFVGLLCEDGGSGPEGSIDGGGGGGLTFTRIFGMVL